MTYRLFPKIITAIALSLTTATARAEGLPQDVVDQLAGLRAAGKYEEAETLLSKQAAVTSHEPHALALLAMLQLDQDKLDQADKTLGPIVKPYLGDDHTVLLAMGITLMLREQYPRAVVYLKRAVLQKPDDATSGYAKALCDILSYPVEDRLPAVLAYGERQDELPRGMYATRTSEALFRVASGRLDRGKMDERTIELLSKALEVNPQASYAAISLANVQIERGEFEAAEQTASRIENAFASKMEEVQYLRGVLAERAGDKETALQRFEDAITLSRKTHVPALIDAARVCMELERYYEARLHLDRVITLAPNNFAARLLFAKYNVFRANETDNPADEGLYLREAEQHCLFAKVREPYNVENLELLEKVYTRMRERGNKKADLEGVQQDLRVARLKQKQTAKNGR